MNVTRMKSMTKILSPVAILLCSYSHAIQPISDTALSNATGDQSPVHLTLTTEVSDADSHQVATDITQTQLPQVEQEVAKYTLEKINTNNLKAIDMTVRDLQLKDSYAIQNLHLNSERGFGLESFSMIWHDGTFTSKVDLGEIRNFTFNNESGQYELSNVQGRVWIVTSFH